MADWIITLFGFNVQYADINSQLQDELTDMRVDLEAQSLFKRKNLLRFGINRPNVHAAVKYLKFCAAVEPFLLAFPISCMFESGVSHAYAFLKYKNRQNSEERGGLLLSTPNSKLHLDKNALDVFQRKHPSH